MACRREQLDLLVVRSWLSTRHGVEAYAHLDALAMRSEGDTMPRRYGDLRVFGRGDDERTRLHLDGFRAGGQVDDRHTQAYAWFWGYRPARGDVFTADDITRTGPSFAAIERGMTRLHEQDGPVGSIGRYVVRLARVLKLDGVAVLETSPNGGFRDEMTVRRCCSISAVGEAVHLIDAVVLELHEACAARVQRAAA